MYLKYKKIYINRKSKIKILYNVDRKINNKIK